MTIIKNFIKILSVVTLLATNAFASDLLVDTNISDASGDAVGGWKYEIDKMNVSWDQNDQITVDIYTNFVDYNNQYGTGQGNGNIVLGDLLMSTRSNTSSYNYAFVLSDTDRMRNNYASQSHWDNSGNFTKIKSTLSAKDYHNNSSSVQNGQVMANETIGSGLNSAWTVDRQNTGQYRNNYDKISFSFNVSGIRAFQNASQVAFSWAMTCANDVVSGIASVNRPNVPVTIPEPTTLLLMLLALAFLAKSRSKKANAFSA